MLVEYSRLFALGGTWLLTFMFQFWIYQDSQRHKKRAWPYIVIIIPIFALITPTGGGIVSTYYWWDILPSRGANWFIQPLWKYDPSQFVEPIWVLDQLLIWGLVLSLIDNTIIYLVSYWIYRDCQKLDIRATPWIFGIQLMLSGVIPYLPIGGFVGMILIYIGFTLHKLGYI